MTNYPGSSQIPAMLVSKCPTDWKEKLASGNYIGTEKMDGFWYELEKTTDGTIYLFSRSKSKVTGELSEKIENVPHIKAWAESLPNDTIIIGEVYYPGKTSKDVTKIMGSLPEKATQRQFKTDEYGGPIHYYIHDVIRWNDIDLQDIAYMTRLEYLDKIKNEYLSNEYPTIKVANTYTDNLEDTLQSIFEQGGEGMVFRKHDSIYKPGKRPKEIFKIKTEETFDCVIIDFIEPEKNYHGITPLDEWPYWIEEDNWIEDEFGRGEYNDPLPIPVTKAYYYGWKAGIIVGLYDNTGVLHNVGNISSGMTDELRKDMAECPDKYLGKVVEVQAMSTDKEELSIRHGRLMRIRDDKNAEECTLESVFK